MLVLFVSPWTKTLFGDKKAIPGHPHVGIAYLVAVLKQNDHKVKFFDQAIEKDDDELFKLIVEFKPDVIGITAFSYCYEYVSKLIKEIKDFTKMPLIIGGPHVSATKGQILKQTKADFAMKGESEVSFLKFLEEIKKEKPAFSKVTNLIWRNDKGEIIENENEPLIEDLDVLPFPDYSEFKFAEYPYYSAKTIPIITSRGCPFGCNFCSVRLSMGRRFRARSPENVVAEIEHWYKQGFRNFEINDDCFSLDLERAEKICDLILEKNLKITYQLYNGIRVDRVSEMLLRKMKASGCVFISYGAESGNQDTINIIGKGITLDQVKKAVNLANKVGIKNSVNFIIGHPRETYEKAIKTLEFARKLPTNFVNIYNLIPYPGTTLFDWIGKNAKWIYPPEYVLENIGSRDLKPVFETNEFTEKERVEVLKKGFDLYERTILTFRLGTIFGMLIYYITRIKPLAKIGRNFALYTKFGWKIYRLLSSQEKSLFRISKMKVIEKISDRGERPIGFNQTFDEIEGYFTTNYIFACNFVKNKKVLDIGSGSGYGTHFMSEKGAKSVIGIDKDKRIITLCQKNYDTDDLQFKVGDANNLDFGNGTFDIITAFELIEHLHNYEAFLKEVFRVLKQDGILIISTPNRKVWSPGLKDPIVVQHVKEFYADELHGLLNRYFSKVKILGKHVLNSRFLEESEELRHRWRMKFTRMLASVRFIRRMARFLPIWIRSSVTGKIDTKLKANDFFISDKNVDNAYSLIAVCQK